MILNPIMTSLPILSWVALTLLCTSLDLKSDISINENGKYIEMRDMATKNHEGDEQDGKSQDGRIYRINGRLCPNKSFTKYLSLFNKDCDAFYQRPKRLLQSQEEST